MILKISPMRLRKSRESTMSRKEEKSLRKSIEIESNKDLIRDDREVFSTV